jgi:hypothetical protein
MFNPRSAISIFEVKDKTEGWPIDASLMFKFTDVPDDKILEFLEWCAEREDLLVSAVSDKVYQGIIFCKSETVAVEVKVRWADQSMKFSKWLNYFDPED